jgi:hypothetical protein
MQIFADRIEFCWIHLRGIGALENSLWGYDGQGIRVWLNALAIEAPASTPSETSPSVKESVNIPLDFYPLCEYRWMQTNVSLTFTPLKAVLMDKGIIIGAEHEAATRKNLPFVMFRHATSVSSCHIHIATDVDVVFVSSLTCFCTIFCSTISKCGRFRRLLYLLDTINTLCFSHMRWRSFFIRSSSRMPALMLRMRPISHPETSFCQPQWNSLIISTQHWT